MDLLITHAHGCTKDLMEALDSFAERRPSADKIYWKAHRCSLNEFAQNYPKTFQVIPIKPEHRSASHDCDYLILVTDKSGFHTC